MARRRRTADRASSVPLGYRLLGVLMRLLVRLLRWRLDVRGVEHVPRSGGAVVTWNHTSHVDFAVTALPLLDDAGRWVRLVALRELWSSRTLGWVPRLARCIPVDRERRAGRDHALRDAIAAGRAGDLVMVAPEGTISESFELLPFRTGAVRIAQAAGVPVLPTVSWGSHRFVTTGHPVSFRRGWRLPVVVRVGPPVDVAPDEDPVAATRRLERIVAAMLAEARDAYPDGLHVGAWWVPASLGGSAPPAAEVLAHHRPGHALHPGRLAGRQHRPHRGRLRRGGGRRTDAGEGSGRG